MERAQLFFFEFQPSHVNKESAVLTLVMRSAADAFLIGLGNVVKDARGQKARHRFTRVILSGL